MPASDDLYSPQSLPQESLTNVVTGPQPNGCMFFSLMSQVSVFRLILDVSLSGDSKELVSNLLTWWFDGLGWHYLKWTHSSSSLLEGLICQRYRDDILQPYVSLLRGPVGTQFILMDDNTRPHKAQIVDEFLESEDIQRMEWPVCSPDLNSRACVACTGKTRWMLSTLSRNLPQAVISSLERMGFSAIRPYDQSGYECDRCIKVFSNIASLLKHRRQHRSEDPNLRFKCNLCPYTTHTPSHLIIHKRIHSGERPHECPQCNNCFTTKSSLKRHMLNHTGSLPFSCDECGSRFRRADTLGDHKKSHTKQRPYLCQNCGKTFLRHHQLLTHLKTHQKFLFA